MVDPEWAASQYYLPSVIAITGAGLVGTFLLRRISKTILDVKTDRQEVQVTQATIADNAILRAENTSLRAELKVLTLERSTAVASLGSLTTRVEFMTDMIKTLREEQAHSITEQRMGNERRASQLEKIDNKVTQNTEITSKVAADVAHNAHIAETAVKRADAAYKEANTVNQKIANIGLTLKNGEKLAPDDQ